MLVNFINNFFTGALSSRVTVKQSMDIPQDLERFATLPCEFHIEKLILKNVPRDQLMPES